MLLFRPLVALVLWWQERSKQEPPQCTLISRVVSDRSVLRWLQDTDEGSEASAKSPTSMDFEETEGAPAQHDFEVVCVKVVKCTNVIGADKGGKCSDPFVKLYLDEAQKQQTKRVDKTLNPVFDEECSFALTVSSLKNDEFLLRNEGVLIEK